MKINLSKEEARSIVSLSLSKRGFEDDIEAKVCIAIDASGSMSRLYSDGSVQALVNRALAVGYKFDDDGAIDVFDFSGPEQNQFLGQATQEDGEHFLDTYRPYSCGTIYGQVLESIESYYYYKQQKRFFGFFGLFGKKAPEGRDGNSDHIPVFLVFITDGMTQYVDYDYNAVNKVLQDHPDLFISFVGLGGADYNFLTSVAAKNDNASFFNAGNLRSISDEDLMYGMLSDKAKNILSK